jgi:hypothetical protein
MRGRGVCPSVTEGSEACTSRRHRVYDVEQVTGAARESIQPGHHQNVTSLQAGKNLGQFNPIGLGTGDLLRVDLRTPAAVSSAT